MGAGALHARAWGMEYIEQGAAVREIPEGAIRKAAGNVCRAILRGRDLCPEGRGNRIRMGALRISEGKDGAARNPSCCWLAQDFLSTYQRFQPKFEAGSPKLSSAEQFLQALLMLASTHHPTRATRPPLLSSASSRGRGREGGREGPDSQPRAQESGFLGPAHHSSAVLGKGADLPVMRSVRAILSLHPAGLMKEGM